MQSHFGGQANLKAIEAVGAVAVEAKNMLNAAVDSLDDLANAG